MPLTRDQYLASPILSEVVRNMANVQAYDSPFLKLRPCNMEKGDVPIKCKPCCLLQTYLYQFVALRLAFAN